MSSVLRGLQVSSQNLILMGSLQEPSDPWRMPPYAGAQIGKHRDSSWRQLEALACLAPYGCLTDPAVELGWTSVPS